MGLFICINSNLLEFTPLLIFANNDLFKNSVFDHSIIAVLQPAGANHH